jgi:beta-galactosidase
MTADGSSPANYPTAISNYQVATYGAECYPGWICEWSQSGQALHASSFAKGTVAPLAAAGCSFVLYVAHGGTNFGFYAAAEGNSPIAIQPLITSYDYGAPISESGAANQGFVPIQQSFATSATYPVTSYATPAPIPSIADGDIPAIAASSFSFADFLAGISPGIQSNLPQTVEWIARQMNASNPANGVYPSGVAVYETTLSASASSITVTFDRPPDYALAFINGVLVPGTVLNTVSNGPFKPVTSFTSSNVPANALLQIVCMPFGRVCFGATGILNEGKGLSQNVYVNGSPVLNWTMMLDPLSAGQLDALVFGAGVPANGHPFFATAPLVVSNPRDMYIDMSNWGTGYVFINGINLGRYWAAAGPQKRLYCPGVWLTQGTNSIVVFEFTQRTAGSLSFYGESGLPYLVS